MSDLEQRLSCRWCRAQSPASARTCERCGAPLDVRDVVTDSGWRQAPRLRDLTEVTFGGSVFQVDGTVVPVADVNLGAGESVFFEHHVMLWKDEQVAMSVMSAPGGAKRLLADLPFVLSVARGPGRVSFSRDSPGELVVLPIDPGVELDVREHAMIVATDRSDLQLREAAGLEGDPRRRQRDVPRSLPAPTNGGGLLLLHGYGNVFERTLAEGESIQIEPGGFLYKDASVGVETVTHKLTAGDSQASSAVQGAKSLASRGFAGLKALRALSKEGIERGLVGRCAADGVGRLHRSGADVDARGRAGPGRHPIDVHGSRVGLMTESHDQLRLPLLPDHVERRRHHLPELRRAGGRGPPNHRLGLDRAPGHSRHDPASDRSVVGADHGQAGPGRRHPPGRRSGGVLPSTQPPVAGAGRAGAGHVTARRLGPHARRPPGRSCSRRSVRGRSPSLTTPPARSWPCPCSPAPRSTSGSISWWPPPRRVGYDWYDCGIWFSTSGDGGAGQSGGAGLLKMGLDLAGLDSDRREERRNEVRYVYPVGRQVDRFTAGDGPGLVLVQCGGNAFVRDLGDGESILVKPPALLFKDPTVGMELHVEYPAAGVQLWRTWGNRYLWLRVTGPGRVGLQSSYDRLEDPGTDFLQSCQYTQHLWT